ncbi:MAG: sigma-70 family RNA polymerase sigma factor [Clostridia bacterium]|nr:sigma-70 family RNA polymerase sigma factor [Clostridia bacterium]
MELRQYNTPEENALIAAAANGDSEAFGSIYTMYERLVYNTVRLKVGNPDDALDLSQEIFVKIWRSIGRYRGDCRFSTWIYKICINACLDFLRHTKLSLAEAMPTYTDRDGDEVEIEFADESTAASPELMSEKRETVRLVRDAIAKLSPDAREVVELRDIQGYSYEEIAEMTGLGIGTVKSRLNRARSHLRELLAAVHDG